MSSVTLTSQLENKLLLIDLSIIYDLRLSGK